MSPGPSTPAALLGLAPRVVEGGLRSALHWLRDPHRAALDPAWWGVVGANGLTSVGLLALGLRTSSRLALGAAGIAALGAVQAFVTGAAVAGARPAPRLPAHPQPHGPLYPHHKRTGLVPWGDDLWVAQQPLVFAGLEVGARMTVVRTPAGLLLYSPIAPTEALVSAVRLLGEVRWIVAPNPFHHLWAGAWAQRFSGAMLWGPSALQARRPDLALSGVVDDGQAAPWAGQGLRTEVVHGNPAHTEIVLLHEATGTLIVAGLIMNIGHAPETPPLTRAGLRLAGMAGQPGPPLEIKLGVTDMGALQRSATAVCSWPVRRILPCHGRPVQAHADQVLHDVLRFAFPGGAAPASRA